MQRFARYTFAILRATWIALTIGAGIFRRRQDESSGNGRRQTFGDCGVHVAAALAETKGIGFSPPSQWPYFFSPASILTGRRFCLGGNGQETNGVNAEDYAFIEIFPRPHRHGSSYPKPRSWFPYQWSDRGKREGGPWHWVVPSSDTAAVHGQADGIRRIPGRPNPLFAGEPGGPRLSRGLLLPELGIFDPVKIATNPALRIFHADRVAAGGPEYGEAQAPHSELIGGTGPHGARNRIFIVTREECEGLPAQRPSRRVDIVGCSQPNCCNTSCNQNRPVTVSQPPSAVRATSRLRRHAAISASNGVAAKRAPHQRAAMKPGAVSPMTSIFHGSCWFHIQSSRCAGTRARRRALSRDRATRPSRFGITHSAELADENRRVDIIPQRRRIGPIVAPRRLDELRPCSDRPKAFRQATPGVYRCRVPDD